MKPNHKKISNNVKKTRQKAGRAAGPQKGWPEKTSPAQG
jgi:hypothetical protein